MSAPLFSRRALLKRAALAGAAAIAGGPRADAQKAGLTIAGTPAELAVAAISRRTVRVTVTPRAGPTTRMSADDGSLVERAWPVPGLRVGAAGPARRLRAGDLVVDVRPDTLTLDVTAGRRRVQSLRIDRDTGALVFTLGDGPVLGLGEGGPQFDRRGAADRARNGQGGYELRTHGARVPVQWLVGTAGWAMFLHRPYCAFTLGDAEGRADPIDAGAPLPLDVFVVSSDDGATLMREYAALTGLPEMPPRWAFGYQQSHRTLSSREEILAEARTFREKKLPCDTLIYLGTGFCPSGWNTDNGEFTFNEKVFPDPAAMIRQFHDEHFKVVLHVVLEGHRLTGTVADPCTAPPLPSGRTADGRWPEDRQVSCYWPVHKPAFDLGVDGWWPDQGDGLDASSRLARNRMYWDGCREWRPDERPYALHRNGCAGMQRYASFLWSGDVYSTWETLKTHVPIAVNAGLSGLTYWGTDIGGFVPTKELTGELYVRWFQFGAFCPLFRAHGRTWKLRLPWGWNTGELGPDEVSNYAGGAANPDPSELHNAAVEPICRKYLELRYRLLPYLYSVVREGHVTGLPIVRALWLHHPDDPATAGRGDEYLWGRDILVAPVVERGAA
ncbi:MAG: glycoside hydrolase family 31 protein, partial [Betaproteobacteria bacterium]